MVNQRIFDTIQRFEANLEETVDKYNRDAKEIQYEANRTRPINFAGEAFAMDAQLAHNLTVIEKFGHLNKSFQTKCDAMILAIDETCRPLLKQDPSARAVGEVVQFIKNVCDELSETATTFTTSFNNTDLGEVGTMQLGASVISQAILEFWKNHYESMPGYDEDRQRIHQEEEKIKQAKRDAERAYEEKKKRAKQKIADEKAAQQETNDRHAKVVEESQKKIAEFAKAVSLEEEKLKKVIIEKARERLEREKAAEEQVLAGLGSFAFGAKKASRKRIAAIENDLVHTEEAECAAEELKSLAKQKNEHVAAYEKKVQDYLNERFSVNIVKEYNCPIQEDGTEHQKIRREILIVLNNSKFPLTAEEIQSKSVNLTANSSHLISALLSELFRCGWIDRCAKDWQAGYSIKTRFSSVTREQWSENKDMKNDPIPEPPEAKAAFQ